MASPTEADLLAVWNNKVTSKEKSGFRRSFGFHPIKLNAGTALYKYSTPYPFDRALGLWTPWWDLRKAQNVLLRNGRLHLCPGLGEHFNRADHLAIDPVRLARVRSAVKHEWNDLQALFLMQLTVPAWGMFGQNAGIPVSDNDPSYAKAIFIGGGYQIYVPQLMEADLSCFAALSGSETGK